MADQLSRAKILDLSTEKPVGLIYSRADLNQYLVEIITFKRGDYLHKGDEPAVFSTTDEAIRQAKGAGARVFFLCLDNTYDEYGSTPPEERFNYLPIDPPSSDELSP